jgi:hypothetical protein
MPEFLKPEVPKKVAKVNQDPGLPVNEKAENPKVGERLVVRTQMPNTPAYWSDLMLANAAFKSYNVSLDLCTSEAQDWSRISYRASRIENADELAGQLQTDMSRCDAAEGKE